MNDLSHFLQQQREAGQVESAGSFTLAIEKARDKLANYNFASSSDYVLKLIQCAVASGVERVHVEVGKNRLLLWFETTLEDTSLTIEKVTHSLLAPLEESNLGRGYLALALCAAAGAQPRELMWGEWTAQESSILGLGHHRSELFRDPPFPRTQPLDTARRMHLFFIEKEASRRKILIRSPLRDEERALRERCWPASIPIVLNGVELGPQLPLITSLGDPVQELTALYLGGLEWVVSSDSQLRWSPPRLPDPTPLAFPPGFRALGGTLPPLFVHSASAIPAPPLEPGRFSELHGFPVYLYGRSYLYYVRHGVMMQPLKLHDAGGGALAILEGDHVKTDLTGLQAVESEHVEFDKQRIVERWKLLVDQYVRSEPPILRGRFRSALEANLAWLGSRLPRVVRDRLVTVGRSYRQERERREAQDLKKFRRQLETRRSYLSYMVDTDPAGDSVDNSLPNR